MLDRGSLQLTLLTGVLLRRDLTSIVAHQLNFKVYPLQATQESKTARAESRSSLGACIQANLAIAQRSKRWADSIRCLCTAIDQISPVTSP